MNIKFLPMLVVVFLSQAALVANSSGSPRFAPMTEDQFLESLGISDDDESGASAGCSSILQYPQAGHLTVENEAAERERMLEEYRDRG